MMERYGRWIAALILIALLLAVVILFGTLDLGLDENSMTDVGSAPILSGADPEATELSPLPQPEEPIPAAPPSSGD